MSAILALIAPPIVRAGPDFAVQPFRSVVARTSLRRPPEQFMIKFYAYSIDLVNEFRELDGTDISLETDLQLIGAAATAIAEITDARNLTEKLYSNIIHSKDARASIGVY